MLERMPWRGTWMLLALLFLAGFAIETADAGQERILEFISHITVQKDGSLLVEETIKVRATGYWIKRGIVRDFPVHYSTAWGRVAVVGFELMGVWRDGKPEPHHTRTEENKIRIFIGQKTHLLMPGEYTYKIKYRTTRQLGFFKDYDELYWNVTGTAWTFAIDRAVVVVELPPGAKVLQKSAYTGPRGAKGEDYKFSSLAPNRPSWTTSRPLAPGEGLTIAVAWPKGLVTEPSSGQRVSYFLSDNLRILVTAGGLVLLWLYFIGAWFKVGRDPKKGPIVPLFAPPEGISPAGARFIMRGRFDPKTFAAALVNLAVKGFLRIEESADNFRLSPLGANPPAMPKGETLVWGKLFSDGKAVSLSGTHSRAVGQARDALGKSLADEYEKSYFCNNLFWFWPGLGVSLAAVIAAGFWTPEPWSNILTQAFLLAWCLGSYLFYSKYLRPLLWSPRMNKAVRFVSIALFTLVFAVALMVGLFIYFRIAGPLGLFLALGIILTNFLFYRLLKAPTIEGRRIRDQIEGFKLYLTMAEKHRWEVLHPPDKTPELFEEYLPYALALGVEHEWSEQFADVVAQAGVGPEAYNPTWYHGTSWRKMGLSGFTGVLSETLSNSLVSGASALGSATAVSRSGSWSASWSSSRPGRRTGSGGRGFSGGGGGGGGGSGW